MFASSTVGERLDGVNTVKLSGVRDFDVAKVFDCGQCFRFNPVKGTAHEVEFSGIAMGRFISVAQDGDTLTIYGGIIWHLTRIIALSQRILCRAPRTARSAGRWSMAEGSGY